MSVSATLRLPTSFVCAPVRPANLCQVSPPKRRLSKYMMAKRQGINAVLAKIKKLCILYRIKVSTKFKA